MYSILYICIEYVLPSNLARNDRKHYCHQRRVSREEFSMSSEDNQEVLRRVIEEGFNKGNYAALDSLFAPDYQEHQFGLRASLEGFQRDIQTLRAAFADLHLTIEDMVADGDKVWIRMTTRGTNTVPFLGPPTGDPMAITVIEICRF